MNPINVRCRYCDEEISLNEDSMEARESGADPLQQMRKHLQKHPLQIMTHARKLGWLIDMLAFYPMTEEHRFKQSLQAMFEYFQTPEALK